MNSVFCKQQIYIFLNKVVGNTEQWAAVAEDGNCLAHVNLPAGTGEVAKYTLGKNSIHARDYASHCPFGYELQFIENINAPEHSELYAKIQRITEARVNREKN